MYWKGKMPFQYFYENNKGAWRAHILKQTKTSTSFFVSHYLPTGRYGQMVFNEMTANTH